MSLDVSLTAPRPTEVFTANITHNLTEMAEAAGLYQALWRPEELKVTTAAELMTLLEAGLERLSGNRELFVQFNSPSGWGSYDGLVKFVENYLAACRKYPDAIVSVCR